MEQSDNDRRAADRARHMADISARLRTACAHLPDEEFRALVLDLANMRLRFDAIDARFLAPPYNE